MGEKGFGYDGRNIGLWFWMGCWLALLILGGDLGEVCVGR